MLEKPSLSTRSSTPARDNDLRGPSGETAGGPDDSSQGGDVEVVHVGVGQKNQVDWRQLVDRDTGMALAAQHESIVWRRRGQ